MEPPGGLARRPARREPDLRRPRRRRELTGLGSASPPPPGPEDHTRGPEGARAAIVYGDYECPFCAALEGGLQQLELRVTFRHFPVRSSHPRAQAAACAAEAAGLQRAFWPFHDALFADQGRLEDPHLWARAEALGLDLGRFEADRRSDAVAARVREQFRGGIRAGVATTPTLFARGVQHAGRPGPELWAALGAG